MSLEPRRARAESNWEVNISSPFAALVPSFSRPHITSQQSLTFGFTGQCDLWD